MSKATDSSRCRKVRISFYPTTRIPFLIANQLIQDDTRSHRNHDSTKNSRSTYIPAGPASTTRTGGNSTGNERGYKDSYKFTDRRDNRALSARGDTGGGYVRASGGHDNRSGRYYGGDRDRGGRRNDERNDKVPPRAPAASLKTNNNDNNGNKNLGNHSIRPRSGSPTRARDSPASNKRSFDLTNAPKGPKKMSFKLPTRDSGNSRYNNSRSYRPQGSSFVPKKEVAPKVVSFLKTSRDSTIYERVIQVGEGTYGKVYKAKNIITSEFVALKRLRMESEREGFPITAMREIRLLQSFDHPNIVKLLEIMVEQKQIYMIFDYADHDLTGILSNPDIKLSDANCKYFFKQLLEGINYLHSKKVIHRDIKGSNLLIDRRGVLKVADFGLARKMKKTKPSQSPDYTNRVITLWYRPPELLLGTTDYGREVDMWGIGCLLVEIFTKKAIFQAQDEIQQLHVIFEIMGTPSFEEWPKIDNLPWYELVKPKDFHNSTFKGLYGSILSEQCFDLALQLLKYDPSKRITAKDALKHEYFKESPEPAALDDGALNGEWHEFEAKKKRRKEREERKLEERKRKEGLKRQKLDNGEAIDPNIETQTGDNSEADTTTREREHTAELANSESDKVNGS